MRASGFVDEEVAPSAPSLTLKAVAKDQTHTVTLFDLGSDKYLAKSDSDAQIYEVTKHSFDRMKVNISSLRDLSIMRFEKNAIKHFLLNDGKQRAAVEKINNAWQMTEPKTLPEKFEFDANSVEDLLSMLSGLNAERLASPREFAENNAWQKNPVVELTTEKEEKIHLYLSPIKANKEEYLVRGNIDDEVYVVKTARINSLLQGLKAFEKVEFDLPPINENTKGFDSLPIDVQRKLLNVTREKKQ
jgi:hypothetical protein